MSQKDVSLYANDVAGLVGDQLTAVEVVVTIFMNDGERYTPSPDPLSHIPVFRHHRYPVCINVAYRHHSCSDWLKPALVDLRIGLAGLFRTLVL